MKHRFSTLPPKQRKKAPFVWRVRYMFSLRLLNISRSGPLKGAVLLLKYRSVPCDLLLRGAGPRGRDPISKREEQEALKRVCRRGAHILKRLMYAIPLSLIAVLVFAAIAVAQDVQKGQQAGQEPSPTTTDTNTTDVQNSTTLPAKKEPAETTMPAESTAPAPNSTTTRGTLPINAQGFDPAQLSIASGTTLKIVNTDIEAHTATADNDLFDTGVLKPGESKEVYFEGAGSVTYHDALHPDRKGSIIVGEGGGVADTTTAPKQTAEEAPNEPSGAAAQPALEPAKSLKGD